MTDPQIRALDYHRRSRSSPAAARARARYRARQRTIQVDGLSVALLAVTPAADALAVTTGRPILSTLVERHAEAVEEYLRLTSVGVSPGVAAVLVACQRKAG